MKKFITGVVTILGMMTLAACGSQANAPKPKSITITSGLKNGKIKDDMETVEGKANGYKYVGYAVEGTVQDSDKVKNGKWEINADDVDAADHEYFYGTNSKPSVGDDFHKGHYKKIIKLAFSNKAQNSATAWSDSESEDEESSSSSDASSEAAASSSSAAATYYSPNYSYDQLARTPDKYEGTKLIFTGQVEQVMEGDSDSDETDVRMAINGDLDHIIYVGIDPDILHDSHILEDDKITVSGTSVGTISYDSTGAGTVTIPALSADKVQDLGTAADGYEY